jgi:hypothetical protein
MVCSALRGTSRAAFPAASWLVVTRRSPCRRRSVRACAQGTPQPPRQRPLIAAPMLITRMHYQLTPHHDCMHAL